MIHSTDYTKGVHGFKNGAPAHVNSSWAEVDLFLNTWGFLPNDMSRLDSLSREQLTHLCLLALDASARINLDGQWIKAIQGHMHNLGISPDSFNK